MNVAVIEQAVNRAIELRGTVMLAVRDNERQWCAVCVAIDGSLELRVGEPGSVGRRRQGRRGTQWLRDHGFVQVIDAWAKPVSRATSAWSCAELLDHGLRDGLAAPADSDLVAVLVHPGVIGHAEPPPPEASHAEHIRFALLALAQQGRGKLVIEGGRPASIWAWAFVIDGELILSPESRDYDDEWRVPLGHQAVARAADQLTDLLHNEFGRDQQASLFISCMPLKPSDPPLLCSRRSSARLRCTRFSQTNHHRASAVPDATRVLSRTANGIDVRSRPATLRAPAHGSGDRDVERLWTSIGRPR